MKGVTDTLAFLLQTVQSQADGREGIDPRFLATLESKLKLAQELACSIKQHVNRRTLPTTNGKSGVVANSLIGY